MIANSTATFDRIYPAGEKAMPAGDRTEVAVLTARMVRGDEDAYRMFHELYFHRLLRYLLVATGGREEAAREALQLTLLRVARHVRRFDTEDSFWSWLTVLARSAVVDEERKRHRYFALLDRFFHREQIDAAVEPDADARLHELLETEVDSLPWDERELIRRKYFRRESVKEIAGDADSTAKAIESRLVRVRRKLKACILKRLNDER